jgi:hypothetical protein
VLQFDFHEGSNGYVLTKTSRLSVFHSQLRQVESAVGRRLTAAPPPSACCSLIESTIESNAQNFFVPNSPNSPDPLIRVPDQPRAKLAVIKPPLLNAHSQRGLAQPIVSEMLSLTAG